MTSRRRWARRGAVAVVVLVALGVWAAIAAEHLLHADTRLRAGVAAGQRVRAELDAEGIGGGGADADLALAHTDFAAAHADVASGWLAPLHVIPIVDTQVRSVEDLSGAAATVTGAGRTTLVTAHAVLRAPQTTPAERVAAVRRLAGSVARLSRVIDGVSLGPAHGLLPQLVTRRNTFAGDLGSLDADLVKARGATAALSDVLTGPGTYLVVATNNAEMRAGSGMMLEAGDLTFEGGTATLGSFQPTSALRRASSTVAPTGDLAARWGFEHPTRDFRALMLSPQFPANAELAAKMWQERTGTRVDGVVTIDVGALADLLAVTGPVSLDGTSYTAADVTRELLVEQYAGVEDDQATAARHERLGALAALVLARAQDGGTSLVSLARAFDQAVDGRHILVWSKAAPIEADWSDAGAGGAVGGDDILLSVLNESADKLDPYLQVSSDMTVTPGRATTSVTVRVTVRNTTPSGLTGYAAGGGAGTPPARQYDGAVALDFPKYAGYARATGGPLQAAGADYGSDVLAPEVVVPDGATATVTFRFVLQGRHGTLDAVASARLPATRWSVRGAGVSPTTFTDDTSHAVSW